MGLSQAIQKELQCSACGGQCHYDPGSQGLICQSCGTHHKIVVPFGGHAMREIAYDPDAEQTEKSRVIETDLHQCETCGAEVAFIGHNLSENCAYCEGPIVLKKADDAFETLALIPFELGEEDAQKAALSWAARRIGAPNDLMSIVSKARVVGIYVPFWTFDSEEAVQYWAKYTVRHDKGISIRAVKGRLHKRFDDFLVPASPHVTPLIRDGILHEFEPRKLRPYRAAYLSGFGAEQHHQSLKEGFAASRKDKDLLIRNRIKRHINRSGVHDIRYKTDTTGVRYRRILLPVWILHYDYENKAKKIVVCGIHGRTFGERPFSRRKLMIYALISTAALMAFGMIWGASGMP